jgi:hypothetical protein
MFYVHNVNEWLAEVIENCSANGLDPEDSVFMLLVFSSLDFDYVDFFKTRRQQISQFSGTNFHIFTPTVFDGVVPDEEWRAIRHDFQHQGIQIPPDPFALFFQLYKRREKSGYAPRFFAGFRTPEFPEFPRVLRRIVESGIEHRKDPIFLSRSFAEILQTNNVVPHVDVKTELTSAVERSLASPRFFISYSHADSEFVTDLHRRLRRRYVNVWLDREELRPGMQLAEEISSALRSSDGLIAVLSKNSINAKWLQFEGSFFAGNHSEKPIIPIVLDSDAKEAARGLPFINDRLYLDFSHEPHDDQFDRLVDAIRKATSG